MGTYLRLTRLRGLPAGTFKKESLVVSTVTERRGQEGHVLSSYLVFDLQSLLEANSRGLLEPLTGALRRNRILIPELLLHRLDEMNKKAFQALSLGNSDEATATAKRFRDLLQFLLQNKEADWLLFQQKGVNEDQRFFRENTLANDLTDARRYVSYALFVKGNASEKVMLVTSDPGLKKCAAGEDLLTVSIGELFRVTHKELYETVRTVHPHHPLSLDA
ncbi:hypothetical protein TraAM80_00256 [Trypanosoma rangeli]|uniref:PIN domain-containing protein n=1 Tax=Trypanosoma rangeli TaxID=5698 RepID=A0A3R7LE16_TRYRA|nr:uncharacterized protein TraAM80_00256 [Trypanosoma rangeli]RNF12540.1 hypothetical protein TraAM80_00256 [Trypanosoma rangeli]|eukprot:RNF12540.1 hypothetical protein TraAM80_00256 [Trypanosoma rangeli]